MFPQFCGGTFFAIPYLGLAVGALPSIAIGAAAYGASELIFHTSKKEKTNTNKSMYDTLIEAKDINNKIGKIYSQIEDKQLVKYIKEIQETSAKIIDTVEKKPEKYKQMDNFFNYYLPVTIKILTKYDEIENQKLSTEEGKEFMAQTKEMVYKINEAFKKQLSNMYQADMIDTDAEMKVFETMLKSDGYSNDTDFKLK